MQRGEFVQGSITDRALLAQILPGIDVVVHIAAWHGIHEVTGQRDAFDFWDVNVTGTFNVLETAVRANITKFVYISSTSVEERFGVYGHTKVLGEEIAQTYVVRHGVNLIALRPRAFIPHWNTDTYKNYLEWTNWFWGGAVHIDDVAQATLLTVDRLVQNPPKNYLCLTVDGAYDYSPDVLANWDADGLGHRSLSNIPILWRWRKNMGCRWRNGRLSKTSPKRCKSWATNPVLACKTCWKSWLSLVLPPPPPLF